jgi:uncharacterized protein (TIGR02246 family)
MDRRRISAGFVVACLSVGFVVAACSKSSQDRSGGIPSDLDTLAFAPESVQVRADVDSGNAQLIQAWRTGSGDLFANAYTEDGTMIRGGGRVIQSRDSITALMGRAFSNVRLRRGVITTLRLEVKGDSVHEIGRYHYELVPISGGKVDIDSGRYDRVWRYESGQWKIWRDVAG